MKIGFVVPKVRSWKRPEHQYTEYNGTKKVWVYTPKELREWEWLIIESAFKGGLVKYPPISNRNVRMEIVAHVKNTWFRDVDNIAKGVLDALQPWFLVDDKYVVELVVRKEKATSEWLEVNMEIEGIAPTQMKTSSTYLTTSGWDDSGWLEDVGIRAVYKFGKFVIGNTEKVWMGTPQKTRRKLAGKHKTVVWRYPEEVQGKMF